MRSLGTKDVDPEEAKRTYTMLTKSIEKNKHQYLTMFQLKNSNKRFEMLLENLPSATIFVSLWMLSSHNLGLRRFLQETLASKLTKDYYWVIVLVSLAIALSCLTTVVNTR